jgi:hypothetical protein
MRTEKDISSKNPETTTVSRFFCHFSRCYLKDIIPQNALWGGIELSVKEI